MPKKKKQETSPVTISAPVGDYIHDQWGGREHYACNLCAFDALDDEKAMLEHLFTIHSSERAMNALIGTEKPNAAAPAAPEPEQTEPIEEEETWHEQP